MGDSSEGSDVELGGSRPLRPPGGNSEVSVEDISPCGKSISEPHLCDDFDDQFSDTTNYATDFYGEEDSDDGQNPNDGEVAKTKKKRRRPGSSRLQYRRKGSSRRAKAPSEPVDVDSDSDEDEDVDVTANLSDLSLTDLDVLISGDEADSSVKGTSRAGPDQQNETETDPEQLDKAEVSSQSESGSGDKVSLGTDGVREETDKNLENPTDDEAALQVDNEYFQGIAESLKLAIPLNEWSIDLCLQEKLVRIIKLNQDPNSAVLTTVYFEKRNAACVGIFIHGKPLPKSHKIFHESRTVDIKNIGCVADYLGLLVSRVESLKVCCGISRLQEEWSFEKGWVDSTVRANPCFRSHQCSIGVEEPRTICKECQATLKQFEREEKRREKEREDISSCPDKYLSKEDIKKKKNYYRTESRKQKKRADRLQRRVDALKVKLDEALKDELVRLLNNNKDKMTKIQKQFFRAQMNALAIDDSRGLRWHPMLIRLALHLHCLSSKAYEFLRDTKVLALPSSRRLYDYAHFMEAKEGCQDEFTQHMKDKILKSGSDDHYSYINLMFDEMSIRCGLVVNRSTGELIGYTRIAGVEEELQQMQAEIEGKTYKPPLAKKVLVYLAQGITSTVKDVVAIYSTDDLSAGQLYSRTWEVIYHLEDAGIKVLTLTCDGAPINRKFIFMHESQDKSCAYTYVTKNLASGTGRPLYFIIDPPHLVKTIRNALANSSAHRKSRDLWKNGESLSWKIIELVYDLTKGQSFISHSLTKSHVKLSSFSCMTVLYAVQVLSNSVANNIEALANHTSLKKCDTKELVVFIRKMNKFFDCVNGKVTEGEAETTNPDKLPFCNPNDERLNFLETEFLNYFEDWKHDVSQRPGSFSNAQRNRMIISHQALGALQITVHGIVGAIKYMLVEAKAPSVCARVFNQDPLEQYFGKIRRMQGDNNNPFLKGVLDTRIRIHAQGNISSTSTKGNTEAEKRKEVDWDDTPLPTRKKRRRSFCL